MNGPYDLKCLYILVYKYGSQNTEKREPQSMFVQYIPLRSSLALHSLRVKHMHSVVLRARLSNRLPLALLFLLSQ